MNKLEEIIEAAEDFLGYDDDFTGDQKSREKCVRSYIAGYMSGYTDRSDELEKFDYSMSICREQFNKKQKDTE